MPLLPATSVQQMVAVPTLTWAATLQSHSTLSLMSPPALLPKQPACLADYTGGLDIILLSLTNNLLHVFCETVNMGILFLCVVR